MNFDDNQKAIFQEKGVLYLKGFISKKRIDPTKDFIYEELSRLGLRKGGKWHMKTFAGVSPFQISSRIAQKLRNNPHCDDLIPKELILTLGNLSGCKLFPAQSHPQILVTPPQNIPWSIPEMGWHVDVATRDEIPGVQVFVLLDQLISTGGGTLAILGSHRARDLAPTSERVLEMIGYPGDVYIMDMRTVHAPAINATKNTRLMLTSRYMANR